MEGGNNKRAREETEADDGLEGPEKKRASSAMLNAGLNGGDPTTNDPAGANAGGDPTGGPPSAEVRLHFFNFIQANQVLSCRLFGAQNFEVCLSKQPIFSLRVCRW